MRLLFILCFLSLQVSATTYFVKLAGSNGNGLTDATAWSYARLNKAALKAGDRVLFKRGDVFFGALTVKSGVAYDAYGQGRNPVISGLKTISGWRIFSGNIYMAEVEPGLNLNLVLLNGNAVGKGRYPNAGYLPYTRHIGKISISGAAIDELPFSVTGAEVVIRKERWILDRHIVTSHKANTLELSDISPDGGYNRREGVDKNGFFIQGHLKTLDKEGEWYYDKSAGRLYMFLPDRNSEVKIATLNTLIPADGVSGISFKDLDFEGSNVAGASLTKSTGVSFSNCGFYHHGLNGIYGRGVTNITIQNCLIQDCLNNGIWVEWDGKNVTVQGTNVFNCGTIAGASRSGDAAAEGISIAGTNTIIRGCTVRKTGYNGIHFNGDNALVENNIVDMYCLVKDDGGGIYTFESDGAVTKNSLIKANTVLHGGGAFAGAESYYYEAFGKAVGIYVDGDCNHVAVTGNVIAHGPWAGFFVNNNASNRFTGNLVFGHSIGVLIVESNVGKIRNLVIQNNRLLGSKALYIKLYAEDDPQKFGLFQNNSFTDDKPIWIDCQHKNGSIKNLNLRQWKKLQTASEPTRQR